jgi:hypothetical protein
MTFRPHIYDKPLNNMQRHPGHSRSLRAMIERFGTVL